MPTTHDPLFATLAARGFDFAFRSHAEAIVSRDFSQAAKELEQVLLDFVIPVTELIAGGGGEAKGTQRLRRALTAAGWRKHRFDVEKRIDGVPAQSRSHEVDHVRSFDGGGRIALEIEWNNKDPFFDRDLEHFQRLHADGAISVGIIVTRGRSLHDGLYTLVRDFLEKNCIDTIEALAPFGYKPTDRQRDAIRAQADRKGFRDAVANVLVSDKFGEATTHWRKLEERIQRGVGNPCPLVLIGLPISVVACS
ncbi:BglII/BstYI family type II restriction endonuclease [Elioraea sp.]|uniref:BglII/BstYI family type II restriction endonuclease n=1 Tax=Elioraea sp. TaxID=2185103 RepID=UPI0021DC678A|nr:BglII/BstYI family type II restriction endonuclease [Elioraea sp.]GIX10955.1 MAG: hypothetical protein KatS3mg116_2665 [Elioraea sp.]